MGVPGRVPLGAGFPFIVTLPSREGDGAGGVNGAGHYATFPRAAASR